MAKSDDCEIKRFLAAKDAKGAKIFKIKKAFFALFASFAAKIVFSL